MNKKNYISDRTFITCIFLFFLISNVIYFYLHLTSQINVSSYSFNELFINYQSGFIRRGLLGEIAWQFHSILKIDFRIFFSIIFFIIHLSNFFLLFLLLKKYFQNKFLFVFIIFSPSLILFHIYDPNMYFIKDSLIKFSILFHAYIFEKFDTKNYEKYLFYLIFPIIIFLILTHEYQIFYIGVHLLITLGKLNNQKITKQYLFFLIPIFFIILFNGNSEQFKELSELLRHYNVTLNPHLSGGLLKYIGGFYKWHFYYFSYADFISLFLSIFLTLILPFLIFQTFLNERIIAFFSKQQKNYFLFLLPALIPFFFTQDHGRNLSLFAFHLIVFYLVLKLNYEKFNLFFKKINSKTLNKTLIFLAIFFYIFLWKLDQFAGFELQGKPNGIFKSSLFAEFIKLIKYLYFYVDLNIINLPEIKL